MESLTLELDREVADLLRPGHGRLEDVVREYVVLEAYRRRGISSGRAAELLGMARFEFVRYASRLGIPLLDMDEDELAEEIQRARAIL